MLLLQWDILSNGGLVQEMAHIANGRDPGNCVSLLRVNVCINYLFFGSFFLCFFDFILIITYKLNIQFP